MAKDLIVKLKVDGSGAFVTLDRFEGKINRLAGAPFANLRSAIAGAFAVGSITAAVKSTIDWAGSLTDVATSLGVSTEWLQEMDYGLKQSGASMEDLAKFTEKLNKARVTALKGGKRGEEIREVFRASFGIELDMLKGRAEPMLAQIGKAFETGNTQALTASLAKLGVRTGGKLAGAFADGALNKAQEARKVGAVVSEEVVEQLDMIGDEFTVLSTVLRANLAPAIIWTIEGIVRMVGKLKANSGFLGAGTSEWGTEDWVKGALRFLPNYAADMAGNIFGADTTSDAWDAQKDKMISLFGGFLGDWALSGKKFDYASAGEVHDSETTAWQAMIQGLKDDVAAKNARRKAMSSLPGFDGIEEKRDAGKKFKSDADELVRVGNFLGSGRNALEQIGEETNRLLSEINDGIAGLSDKLTDDLGLD
jgi:hypothetical protein